MAELTGTVRVFPIASSAQLTGAFRCLPCERCDSVDGHVCDWRALMLEEQPNESHELCRARRGGEPSQRVCVEQPVLRCSRYDVDHVVCLNPPIR